MQLLPFHHDKNSLTFGSYCQVSPQSCEKAALTGQEGKRRIMGWIRGLPYFFQHIGGCLEESEKADVQSITDCVQGEEPTGMHTILPVQTCNWRSLHTKSFYHFCQAGMEKVLFLGCSRKNKWVNRHMHACTQLMINSEHAGETGDGPLRSILGHYAVYQKLSTGGVFVLVLA